MILGAGRGQIGLYKAAKKLGIKTIAATLLNNDPPALSLADEICEVNIYEPDEVYDKTKNFEFNGVITCCFDNSLKALGRLCDEYKLSGFSEETANLCSNKFLMKQKFMEFGVSSAPFDIIKNETDLKNAIKKLGGFPLIIKATDLAGSKGIIKVYNLDDAKEALNKVLSETKKDFVLIERLLTGNEFGAQAFIQNGEIKFIMPHGDILFHGATDVPIGHYVPLDISENVRNQIYSETEKASKAVGLDNCAINLDFIEEDGKVYLLELSGRIGANGLPELVNNYYGIDYYEMVLLAALGQPVDELWSKRKIKKAVLSRMIISPDKSGILESIEIPEVLKNKIKDYQIFIKSGSEFNKFENSNHCIGQFTISCDNIEECEILSNEILSKIIIKEKI